MRGAISRSGRARPFQTGFRVDIEARQHPPSDELVQLHIDLQNLAATRSRLDPKSAAVSSPHPGGNDRDAGREQRGRRWGTPKIQGARDPRPVNRDVGIVGVDAQQVAVKFDEDAVRGEHVHGDVLPRAMPYRAPENRFSAQPEAVQLLAEGAEVLDLPSMVMEHLALGARSDRKPMVIGIAAKPGGAVRR